MLFYPNIKYLRLRTMDNVNSINLGRVEVSVKSTAKADECFKEIENIFVDVDIPISLVLHKGR